MIAPLALAGVGVFSAPMRVVRNLPFVQARIAGGKPYWFMIDTGTDPSVIDFTLAKTLRLRFAASGTGTGGGTGKARLFRERSVAALATDLSSLGKRLGFPFGGVLGYSFLRGHVVQIDYAAKQLRFFDASFAAPPACSFATPFSYVDDVVIHTARINGRHLEADLDTGSNGYLAFTPTGTLKAGLSAIAMHGHASSGQGYNGVFSARETTVQDFSIGPIAFDATRAVFWPRGSGHDDRPWDVNVGGALLSRFAPVFDYVHHRVYFC